MEESKRQVSIALFLAINLVFFTMVSACGTCPSPTPKKKPPPSPKTPKTPTPPSPPSSKGKCPKDTLKLGVCADLLGLVNVVVGGSSSKCCSLLQGLTDLDAEICLCTAIKANILGINLNIPVTLSLLLNTCGKKSSGYKC